MEQITDIKAIQELLFGCLSHFKTICEKHRLTYYLSNGTLLGAVKYGDFIPWDDDADVLMPREDYERFMSLSDAETERYGLLCQNGKTGWKYPYAKLSDKTTVLKELEADFGAEVGISLDIFPLDYRTNGKTTSSIHAYRCAFLKRLMSFAVQDEFHPNPRGIKRIVLWMLYYFSRAIGTKRLKEKLLRIAVKSNKNSPKNYCGPVVWTCYNKGESSRSEVFSDSVTIKFHGSEFNAPVGYDEYLRGLYGDYEPDPPPEKQKSNHFVTIYSKS